MDDPRYRVTTGCDGAEYVYFFGHDRRVMICIEDGEASVSLATKGSACESVDLTPDAVTFAKLLFTWLGGAPPQSSGESNE